MTEKLKLAHIADYTGDNMSASISGTLKDALAEVEESPAKGIFIAVTRDIGDGDLQVTTYRAGLSRGDECLMLVNRLIRIDDDG